MGVSDRRSAATRLLAVLLWKCTVFFGQVMSCLREDMADFQHEVRRSAFGAKKSVQLGSAYHYSITMKDFVLFLEKSSSIDCRRELDKQMGIVSRVNTGRSEFVPARVPSKDYARFLEKYSTTD